MPRAPRRTTPKPADVPETQAEDTDPDTDGELDQYGQKLTFAIQEAVRLEGRPLSLPKLVELTGRSAEAVRDAIEQIARDHEMPFDAAFAELVQQEDPEFGEEPAAAPGAPDEDERSALSQALAAATDDEAPPDGVETPDQEIRVNSGDSAASESYAKTRRSAPRDTGTETPLPGMPGPSIAWGRFEGREVTHGMGSIGGSFRLPDELADIRIDSEITLKIRLKERFPGYRANPMQEGQKAKLHKNISFEIVGVSDFEQVK